MEKWCHPYERYVSYTQMAPSVISNRYFSFFLPLPSSPLFFFLFLSFFFSKIILGELEKLYPLPSPIIYLFGERMLIIPVSEFGNQAMIKPNYERIICPRKQNTIRPINRLLGWIRTLCFRFVSSAARVGKCFIGMRWALGREMKSRS